MPTVGEEGRRLCQANVRLATSRKQQQEAIEVATAAAAPATTSISIFTLVTRVARRRRHWLCVIPEIWQQFISDSSLFIGFIEARE